MKLNYFSADVITFMAYVNGNFLVPQGSDGENFSGAKQLHCRQVIGPAVQ